MLKSQQHSNEHLYRNLPLGSGTSIRLLQKRSQSSHGLTTSLSVHELTDTRLYYNALSYTWGPPNFDSRPEDYAQQVSILCNGQVVVIPKNLYDAICHLQIPPQGYLWVDALCINQADFKERAAQVNIMGSIYARATTVFVWIGMDTALTRRAFDIMNKFVYAVVTYCEQTHDYSIQPGYRDQTFWDRIGINRWTKEDETALVHVYNRKWFQRGWVVQEVALAKEPLLICGASPTALLWEVLTFFSNFLLTKGWAIEFNELQASTFRRNSGIYLLGTGPGLMEALRNYCREGYLSSGNFSPMLKTVPLGDIERMHDTTALFYCCLAVLIAAFRPSHVTLPHDKIYAPLALAIRLFSKRPPTSLPLVDYSEPWQQLYTRIGIEIIEHTGNLSWLSHVECRGHLKQSRLPSWVPNLFNSQVSPLIYFLQPRFDATKHWKCALNSSIDGRRLDVNAVFIDFIAQIGPSSAEVRITDRPTAWLEFCYAMQKQYFNGQHRAEAFARTLICNQEESSSMDSFAAEFRAYLKHTCIISDEISEMLAASDNHDKKSLQPSWPILEKFEYADPNPFIPTLKEIFAFVAENRDTKIMGRNFDAFGQMSLVYGQAHVNRGLVMTKQGYIGLASNDVMVGDWIVLVPTAKVPFVVRAKHGRRLFTGDGTEHAFAVSAMRNSSQYRFMGEMYLHGFMQGEYLEDNATRKTESVELT